MKDPGSRREGPPPFPTPTIVRRSATGPIELPVPGAGTVTPGDVAKKLHNSGIFTGGPPELFESAGRLQLATLLREGIYPFSKTLDIGCGCLRAGYWLVRFLDSDCYFGIEPAREMLESGIENLLGSQLVAIKRPVFSTNDGFDFSVFGVGFDVYLARSVWPHASRAMIQRMLDSFVETCNPDAFFLTSYLPESWIASLRKQDYRGKRWIGRSHESSVPGQVRHDRRWIEGECRARGLWVRQLPDKSFNGQYWLKIAKNADALKTFAAVA